MVTSELRKFISDFDRVDATDLRDYLYAKIKSGKYQITT